VLTFLGGDPDAPSGDLPVDFNRKAKGSKPPLSPEFRRVLTFLGGDPDEPSGNLPPGFNRKARGAKPPLSPEFRRVLGRLMADELKASAAEFGGAAAGWPARYGL
jgi:hypothetical protein